MDPNEQFGEILNNLQIANKINTSYKKLVKLFSTLSQAQINSLLANSVNVILKGPCSAAFMRRYSNLILKVIFPPIFDDNKNLYGSIELYQFMLNLSATTSRDFIDHLISFLGNYQSTVRKNSLILLASIMRQNPSDDLRLHIVKNCKASLTDKSPECRSVALNMMAASADLIKKEIVELIFWETSPSTLIQLAALYPSLNEYCEELEVVAISKKRVEYFKKEFLQNLSELLMNNNADIRKVFLQRVFIDISADKLPCELFFDAFLLNLQESSTNKLTEQLIFELLSTDPSKVLLFLTREGKLDDSLVSLLFNTSSTSNQEIISVIISHIFQVRCNKIELCEKNELIVLTLATNLQFVHTFDEWFVDYDDLKDFMLLCEDTTKLSLCIKFLMSTQTVESQKDSLAQFFKKLFDEFFFAQKHPDLLSILLENMKTLKDIEFIMPYFNHIENTASKISEDFEQEVARSWLTDLCSIALPFVKDSEDCRPPRLLTAKVFDFLKPMSNSIFIDENHSPIIHYAHYVALATPCYFDLYITIISKIIIQSLVSFDLVDEDSNNMELTDLAFLMELYVDATTVRANMAPLPLLIAPLILSSFEDLEDKFKNSFYEDVDYPLQRLLSSLGRYLMFTKNYSEDHIAASAILLISAFAPSVYHKQEMIAEQYTMALVKYRPQFFIDSLTCLASCVGGIASFENSCLRIDQKINFIASCDKLLYFICQRSKAGKNFSCLLKAMVLACEDNYQWLPLITRLLEHLSYVVDNETRIFFVNALNQCVINGSPEKTLHIIDLMGPIDPEYPIRDEMEKVNEDLNRYRNAVDRVISADINI